jgi:hypothetical protein
MNPQALSVALFPVFFGIVIVWFVLIKLLYKRLEREHPQKYEAMGKPSLFLRNHISGSFATFKFLVSREHRALNDRYLSKLSDAMLVFFAIYLLLFFGLFVIVATQAPAT